MATAAAWILGEIFDYAGLLELFVILGKLPAVLIAQGHEPYPEYFMIEGTTLAGLRDMHRVTPCHHTRRQLDILLKEVALGSWACYGFWNGNIGNFEFNATYGAKGSDINARWAALRRRLQEGRAAVKRLIDVRLGARLSIRM